MAIWHVETMPGLKTSKSEKGMSIIPNYDRCGKITESLYFDVTSDPDVEISCRAALWPAVESSDGKPPEFIGNRPSRLPLNEVLQGTRCGVFPIPSNFSVSNLYAVLMVRKVFSDDSDEAYVGSPTQKSDLSKRAMKGIKHDLISLRNKAMDSANRYGRFLMPFAFGVVPLAQVIGSIPNAKAVQVPLFRFQSSGERPIIDHIVFMLHPR